MIIQGVPQFSQKDTRWSRKKLGFGNTKIGTTGCLVAVMASLCKYYGKDTDPGKLNDALKEVDGFAVQNMYKWYSISDIYPDIRVHHLESALEPVTSSQWIDIEFELEYKRPVVLEVDFIPSTAKLDMHFVLLIGKEGNHHIIIDPWTGKQEYLEKYGDPSITVQRFCFHKGPAEHDPMSEVPGLTPLYQETLYADEEGHRSKFMEMWHKVNNIKDNYADRRRLEEIYKEVKKEQKSMATAITKLAIEVSGLKTAIESINIPAQTDGSNSELHSNVLPSDNLAHSGVPEEQRFLLSLFDGKVTMQLKLKKLPDIAG